MRTDGAWRASSAVLFTAILCACADGGGETGTGVQPTKPPRETVHTGPITGFGSIFVNGVEFETGSSRITVDGARTSELDLAIGMVVTVRGVVDANRRNGTASRVQYASDIDGVVLAASISAVTETGTLNVMGRTVMVDENTVFDSAVATIPSVALIPPGSIVEISGHTSGASDVHATRVALKNETFDGREIDVKGVIANVTDTGFDLGTLHVDYALASSLLPGWYVSASGTRAVIDNTWTAATVTKLADSGVKPPQTTDGDPYSGRGVITGTLLNEAFTLGEVTVSISAATQFTGGTATDLVAGRRVGVEGITAANGVVNATIIEFVPVAAFGLEAALQNVSAGTSTINLLGATFQLDGDTILKDERDAVRGFSLASLAVGDRLSLRFAQTAGGELLATKVIRTKSSSEPDELSGPITAEAGAYDIAGIPISFTTCLPSCTPPVAGEIVELDGSWTGAEFAVQKRESEDDD
jgi:hypothetical protein